MVLAARSRSVGEGDEALYRYAGDRTRIQREIVSLGYPEGMTDVLGGDEF